MPVLAEFVVPLEQDESHYLNIVQNYENVGTVNNLKIYQGSDSEIMPNYKHLVIFDGITCVYSCYFIEYSKFIECSEVRQHQSYKGLARKVFFEYLLPTYCTVRMSVGVTQDGHAMWQKIIKQVKYCKIVESYLSGSKLMKMSERGFAFTTNREPTTPVYIVSNSRIYL